MAKKAYLYVIETREMGGETVESAEIFESYGKAKDTLMWHYSAQRSLQGEECVTVEKFEGGEEEKAPIAGLWKFGKPMLYIKTQDKKGKHTTIRVIFEEDLK